MARSRRVNTSRVTYGRRPAPAPKRGRMRPNAVLIKLGLQVGLALVAVVGLWRVFGVGTIKITGNKTVLTADIVRAAEASFNHHPFSRNLLTLGLAPLSQDILADQRLGEVHVTRVWPSGVTITVSERQLSLGWKSGGSVYVLDSNGVAVALVGEQGTKLAVVTDSTSLPVTVGSRVVPQRFVQFTLSLAGELTPMTGLAITSMSVPDTTSELYVKTSVGYTVKFDTTSGAEDQLTSLKTVLATLKTLKKTPAEYIDLRVPNKAYYR